MGKLVCAATIAAALLIGSRPAAAGGDGRRETLVQKTRGGRAEFVSSAGCVTTTVIVTLNDTATERSPGGKSQLRDAVITVEQIYDPALGPGCARLDPIIQDSRADILGANLHLFIDGDLEAARLNGTGDFDDAHTGTHRTMKFDLRWKGRGKTKKTKTHEVSVQPDKTVTTDLEVRLRQAQACGFLTEVVAGKKVNHTPRPSLLKETNLRREELKQVTVKK